MSQTQKNPISSHKAESVLKVAWRLLERTRLWVVGAGVLGMLVYGEGVGPKHLPENVFKPGMAWLNTSRTPTAADFKNRMVLLDFWTYCCINCMHVLPEIAKLEKKLGNSVLVVGVHSAKFDNEKESENIRNAILRYGIEHPVVNDSDFKVWRAFGVEAWPTLVLLNPDGQVEHVYPGEGNTERIERDIEAISRRFAGKMRNSTAFPVALERDKKPEPLLSFPGKVSYTADFQKEPALFISDSNHGRIVVARPSGKIIQTIGTGVNGFHDGGFAEAQFNRPQGTIYKAPFLYVADTENHRLRRIDFEKRTVESIAGSGHQGSALRSFDYQPAETTALTSPWDVAFGPRDGEIALAMAGAHQLWTYSIPKRTVSLLAGSGRESIDDGVFPAQSLAQTSGLSAVGNQLYFVDSETSSLRILEKNRIKTLVGIGLFDFGLVDGPFDRARLQHPLGLAAAGKNIYIADSYNHALRQFDLGTEKLSTLIGNGKPGELNEPGGLAVAGNLLYIADTNNNRIRIFHLETKKISTLELEKGNSLAIVPSENLPNVQKGKLEKVSSRKFSVQITLPPKWKINEQAISYVALFRRSGKNYSLVEKVTKSDLKSGAVGFSGLLPGDYRLQATLYYCGVAANSVCVVQSFDQSLKLDEGYPTKNIEINLKKPVGELKTE